MLNHSQLIYFDMGFHLQTKAEGQQKCTCPKCEQPRCFTYYIDDNGNVLDPKVGRCDHQNKCGYDYKPKDFFRDNPTTKEDWEKTFKAQPPREPEPPRPFEPLSFDLVVRSHPKHSPFDNLTTFLLDESKTTFTAEQIFNVYESYAIGCTKTHETIFWQIDINGKVHSGKIMLYNNAHRVKVPFDHMDWVHARMQRHGGLSKEWKLYQCLFGEHLLHYSENRGKHIALVESEKSAIIGALKYPHMIWLACGGKYNLKTEICKVLTGRVVHVFPDVDGVEEWKVKVEHLQRTINAQFVYEVNWMKFAQDNKEDIADVILRYELSTTAKVPEPCKHSSLTENETQYQLTPEQLKEVEEVEKELGCTKPHEGLRALFKVFDCARV